MHWKIAECSLSTGSIRTPFSRARRVTSSPAITITSFVASAMSIPFSIAATVGRSPDSPTVETRQMSASFSSTALSAASSPTYALAPNSAASASALSRDDRADSATTENSPGCVRTTSAALVPIDPVAPRTISRFCAEPGIICLCGTSTRAPGPRKGRPACRRRVQVSWRRTPWRSRAARRSLSRTTCRTASPACPRTPARTA